MIWIDASGSVFREPENQEPDFIVFFKQASDYLPGLLLISRETVKEGKEFFLSLLSQREEQLYCQYKAENKRLEFLAGRVLLKRQVAVGNAISENRRIDFKMIEVLRKESGEPYIQWKQKIINVPSFSVSHKDGMIAAAYLPGRKIGLDLERVSRKLFRVKSAFISCEEIRLMRRRLQPQEEELLMLARIWSAKEAVVKYLCSDLMTVFKTVQLIEINDKSLTFLDGKTGEKLTVSHFIYKDLVLSAIKT